MDSCGDCGSMFAYFGFHPAHSAPVLADVLQFVASKLDDVHGQRMVFAVVCGPQNSIGGYLLHGTGVTSCTSSPAMDAVARGVDGMVQALQLVVSTNAQAVNICVDELADDGSLLDEVPRSPRAPSSRRPAAPHGADRRNGTPAPALPPFNPRASTRTLPPELSPPATRQARPALRPAGGAPATSSGQLSSEAARGAALPTGFTRETSLPLRSASPAPSLASSFPALIPWLTLMPTRLCLPSPINCVMQGPPPAQETSYDITDKVVGEVVGTLMVHKKERGSSKKLRLAEFFSLFRYNVIKRSSVDYTFENTTPEVARNATICWWKGKNQIKETNPRICNSSAIRVRPILSVVLLMIYLENPAFLAIPRHFKGGALVQETSTAWSVTPAESTARKRKKQLEVWSSVLRVNVRPSVVEEAVWVSVVGVPVSVPVVGTLSRLLIFGVAMWLLLVGVAARQPVVGVQAHVPVI